MKAKKKISKLWVFGLFAILVMAPLLVLLFIRMEGKPPSMELKMDGAALGAEATLTLEVADGQTGLRQVWVALLKDGKETVLAEKQYPSVGVFTGSVIKKKSIQIQFDAKALGVKDGKAILRMVTRDYSWRKWGDGNQLYKEQEIVIDTQAPRISILSHPLNMNQGGSGIVAYRLSEGCRVSGIMVGEEFYPGLSGAFSDAEIYLAFVALTHKQGAKTRIHATATDYAGNQGRTGIARHINSKRFRRDTIRLSEGFLSWKMPELQGQVEVHGNASLLDVFLKVNGDLRKANYETFKKVTAQSDAKVHWEGAFMRLPNAANRAGYADFRNYTYKGKKVDQQTHLGIDLASLNQATIPAANTGRVAFAENLGIYGLTVVIDHGFGLFSVYAHLSEIGVSEGQMVSKGDDIGRTGKTGLAGGDHLHFSMMVRHTFVNPVEWWDAKWVRNNVGSKLDEVQ